MRWGLLTHLLLSFPTRVEPLQPNSFAEYGGLPRVVYFLVISLVQGKLDPAPPTDADPDAIPNAIPDTVPDALGLRRPAVVDATTTPADEGVEWAGTPSHSIFRACVRAMSSARFAATIAAMRASTASWSSMPAEYKDLLKSSMRIKLVAY